MPTTATSFSEEEMDILADKIAVRLLPMLVECLKNKTKYAINQLQGEYLNAQQVAEIFNVSDKTIYRLWRNRALRTTSTGHYHHRHL